MEMNRENAKRQLALGEVMNPGRWGDHSRNVARACELLAGPCGLNVDLAYCYGLLHDIGRREGKTSERHLLDGYLHCISLGWDKAAEICLNHAFIIPKLSTGIGIFDMSEAEYRMMREKVEGAVYDDYDRLIQLCDGLALPDGFCLLEKRLVDVALRYGLTESTLPRWRALIDIKKYFDEKVGGSIYSLLPKVVEQTFQVDF